MNVTLFQFFRGFLDSNQLEGARRIEDMYSFIKKVSIRQRHVEVTHRESPLLVMTMQHRSRVLFLFFSSLPSLILDILGRCGDAVS